MNNGPYDYNNPEVKAEMKRFSLFCRELEKLSMKYEICLQCFGGVDIYDIGSLKKVEYIDDWSSGDLEYEVSTY